MSGPALAADVFRMPETNMRYQMQISHIMLLTFFAAALAGAIKFMPSDFWVVTISALVVLAHVCAIFVPVPIVFIAILLGPEHDGWIEPRRLPGYRFLTTLWIMSIAVVILTWTIILFTSYAHVGGRRY